MLSRTHSVGAQRYNLTDPQVECAEVILWDERWGYWVYWAGC